MIKHIRDLMHIMRRRQQEFSKKDGIVNGWGNPSSTEIKSFNYRIKERNANFIRDKSKLVLAEILKLYLKMATYEPLRGSSWKPLPKFIKNKKAVINIKNEDNIFFGYAMLYFLERPQKGRNYRNYGRSALYTDAMLERNNLGGLPYPNNPFAVSN